MKHKRTLKYFDCLCGYNGNDFIMNRKTFRITYVLNRQTKRRGWVILLSREVIQFDSEGLKFMIWQRFKKKFNIVG